MPLFCLASCDRCHQTSDFMKVKMHQEENTNTYNNNANCRPGGARLMLVAGGKGSFPQAGRAIFS